MALGAIQTITKLGTTPNPQTPSATENITADGPLILRVANSGSSGTVTLVDPGLTPTGSSPVNPVVTIPATTGVRLIYLPATLINPATGQMQLQFATGTFLGELYRV